MNDFITSAYWQREWNDSALLFQHYRYRENPICFACVCAGEEENQGRAGAYLTRQLLTWFRGLHWGRLAKDPESRLQRLGNRLEKMVERTEKEVAVRGLLQPEEKTDFAGIFCIREHFLLFHQGNCQICLLNRCFDRGHLQRIVGEPHSNEERGITLRQGILQQEIGLLIATESFCARLADWELKECLHVETVGTQEQADRHLLELGHRAEEQGGQNMGAVLLLTKSKKI